MRSPRVTARGGLAQGPARAATGSYARRTRLPHVTARGGAAPRASPGCHKQPGAAHAVATRRGAWWAGPRASPGCHTGSYAHRVRLPRVTARGRGSPEGQPGLSQAARSRACGRPASLRVVGWPKGQHGLPRAAMRIVRGCLASRREVGEGALCVSQEGGGGCGRYECG